MAHSAGASLRLGIPQDKLDAVWDYRSSPLFPDAERVAIEFAIEASGQPNGVTDELFERMKQHWTEAQIVEITGVIALFGFLNRWNDTMATPLEDEPARIGEAHLGKRGWSIGKHRG